ncbi:MAG: YerC/YecD family TrpR-related protein [Candidatus Pacebacteria bacterium]|jgi:TrpR-related protein YerC/YecD|nr:YerC/YecD family TrpR-related protein [Candidatus Paceibacterota bacterium]
MTWKTAENQKLVEAILGLKTADETERFLRDLMTEGEITEFAKRLKAAEMLADKVPYLTIETKTGLSSTTVARVSKWLFNGMGGYKIILNRLHHHPKLLRAGTGGF